MFLRSAAVLVGIAFAFPVAAQELNAEQARRFVVGKTFSYTCFEGTRGAGRIRADGSVAGTIQMQGKGPNRHALLPPNTLRVQGERVCASVRGLPFEPCFNIVRTSARSFRGSLSGFNFAYCDFTRGGGGRREMLRSVRSAPRDSNQPLALRSTMTR
jgi:hypothetical protein